MDQNVYSLLCLKLSVGFVVKEFLFVDCFSWFHCVEFEVFSTHGRQQSACAEFEVFLVTILCDNLLEFAFRADCCGW